jgi:hypothetical protein
MRRRSIVLSIVFALGLVIAAPKPAEAVTLRLGLAANYWFVHEGVFNVDISVTAPVASFLSVGGRFGGALVTGTPTFGVPIDLLIHIPIERLYIEVMGGPWIFFDYYQTILAHVAFGFGIGSGPITFGLEAGYLDPRTIVGARFGYRF